MAEAQRKSHRNGPVGRNHVLSRAALEKLADSAGRMPAPDTPEERDWLYKPIDVPLSLRDVYMIMGGAELKGSAPWERWFDRLCRAAEVSNPGGAYRVLEEEFTDAVFEYVAGVLKLLPLVKKNLEDQIWLSKAVGKTMAKKDATLSKALERLLELEEKLKVAERKVISSKRRRRPPFEPKARPLTYRQTEVVRVVGECKENFAEAARRLRCDPKTVREAYHAAMKKLREVGLRNPGRALRPKTKRLPEDRRGQANTSKADDKRHDQIV